MVEYAAEQGALYEPTLGLTGKLRGFLEEQVGTRLAHVADYCTERRRLPLVATTLVCAAALAAAVETSTALAEQPASPQTPVPKIEPGIGNSEIVVPNAPTGFETLCGDPSYRAPRPIQIGSVLCRINLARANIGEAPLTENRALDVATEEKLADDIDCRHYSHAPCVGETVFDRLKQNVDLIDLWFLGENLAYGIGSLGSARSVFGGWWQSPPHRANILDPNFTEIGLAIKHEKEINMAVDTEGGNTVTGVLLQNVTFVGAEFMGNGQAP